MITIPRTPPDFAHPKLKVIGLGGAGGNALDRLVLDGLEGAEAIAINTDLQGLAASVATQRIQIGHGITRGLGTGGDPEMGRSAAEECSGELQRVLADATLVFVLVGLGGGTGSGALPVIADLAHEQNAFVVVLGTFPFAFEGKRRKTQAEEALDAVRGLADLVICFENDQMADLVAPSASVQQALAAADETLSQCVRAMAALAHRRGILRVSFDEIGNALRGQVRSYFGYGEAGGENRAFDAMGAALRCPLLDQGRALRRADSVVVQIVGGDDFTLNELSLAMDEVSRQITDETRLYFGTTSDAKMTGRISVSIFCGAAAHEAGELPAVAAESRSKLDKSQPAGVESEDELRKLEDLEPVTAPASADDSEEELFPAAVPAAEEFSTPVNAESDVYAAEEEEAEAQEIEEPTAEIEEEEEFEEEDGEDEEAVTAESHESVGDEAEIEEEEAAPQGSAAPPKPLPRHPIFARMDAARRAEAAAARATAASPVQRAREERQEQMTFEPVNRGRFEKSEPTIIDGQDLDVPTFMRRKTQ